MTRNKITHVWLAAVAMLVAGGCEQMYNGAWGLKADDLQTAQQAAREREAAAEREKAMAAAAKGAQQAKRVESGSSAGASTPSTGQAQSNAAAAAEPQPTTPTAGRNPGVSIGALGLYGQLPATGTEKSGSSVMDSPDNLRRVTYANEGDDFDPDVDPSGTLLVYASTQHRSTADLYVKKVDGTAVTQLTNDPGNDVMPCFSPDGKKIAFASDRSGNWDVYIMDASGGQAVQLTSDPTQDLHPSFSPDGKQVVFCTYGSQSGQWELVLVDLEKPASKKFIGFGLFPNWSPVDNRIVFQKARERGTRWFSIWTMEIKDGEGVRPTEVAASSNAAAIAPHWSHDGQHIVFCTVVNPEKESTDKPVQSDVWIVRADGTGRSNLTHSPFANLQPVWSSDGGIYFVSNRGKNAVQNVWSIRPDQALRVAQPPSAPTPAPSAMVPDPH